MIYTLSFNQVDKQDSEKAGGKGASLGEMTQIGIPVPPGFVLLSSAFEQFLKETDLNVEIDNLLHEVDVSVVHTVEEASAQIQTLIKGVQMPAEIAGEIEKAFGELDSEYVAVRSSATAEDSASAAWAGQLDSFLNTTQDTLLEKVQACWASLFTPRAIFYRFEKELHTQKISVAVVVQKMVNSEKSGIAFSVHPVTEDRNQLIIEAGFGLGEAIVSGQITPDSYVVEKQPRRIIDTNIAEQQKGLFRKQAGGNEWRELGEKGKERVLSEEEVLELSEIILTIENHYGFPCDVEWAYEDGKFYITQSRPITTLTKLVDEKIKNKGFPSLSPKDIELFEQIKQVDWKYLVNRQEVPLFKTLTTRCYDYFEEVTGIEWKPTAEFRPGGDVLYSAQELGLLAQKFVEGGTTLLDSFYTRLEKYIQQFDDVAYEISQKDVRQLSSEERKSLLQQYMYAALRAHAFLLPMPVADQIISQKILSYLPEDITEGTRQEWLAILSYPIKENEHTREERSFYLLAKSYKKVKFNALLKQHLQEFSWIGARWYFWHRGWTEGDIIERLEEFFAQGRDPDKEIEHLNNIRSERQREREKLILKLNLTKTELEEVKNLISFAQQYAYARTWRTDVVYRAGYRDRDLFEEIVKRVGFEGTDAQYMDIFEIQDIVQGQINITQEEITRRREFYGSVYLNDQFRIFSGEIWRQPLQELYSLEKPSSKESLQGVSAYKGKVKGRAKVVYTAKEMHKVSRGDILVSVMTFPDLIPAMEKAAAFVTDEGGILCHAAIISREMKKPCVTSTKNATKILKDGMELEVDADNGMVKILDKTQNIQVSDWYHLGKWVEPALAAEVWLEYAQVAQRFFKGSLDGRILYLNGDFFLSQHDVDIIKKESYEAAKNNDRGFFETITQEVARVTQKLKKEIHTISSVSDFLESYKELTGVWMPLNIVATGIEQYVQETHQDAFKLSKGFVNEKPWTFQQADEMHVLKNLILEEVDSIPTTISGLSDDLQEKIKVHVKKYQWLGTHHFNINGLTEDKVLERMKNEQSKDESKNIEDDSVQYLVQLLDTIGFVRFRCAETSGYTTYYLYRHIKTLAEDNKLTYEDIVEHTIPEIKSGDFSTHTAEIRRDNIGFLFDGKEHLLSEEEIQTYAAELLNPDVSETESFSGVSAHKGRVRGEVMIVTRQEEMKDFRKGMILVAYETTPDIIVAMEKAAAIITDFGGLTSHAAIVARELGVPCVVGTNVATKALKSGMRVEVDADKGVVIILNK